MRDTSARAQFGLGRKTNLVVREWHAITRHDRIENDVRVCKLLVHTVERLYELVPIRDEKVASVCGARLTNLNGRGPT